MDARRSGLYGRVIGPRLLDVACGCSVISSQRSRVVPLAEGVVLEVGIGSGANLPFYDKVKVERIIGVDPGGAKLRREDSGIPVELIDAGGESIPLGDAMADTAVLTYTLCSVGDPGATLAEIRRVLRPGGTLLVCEHGLARDVGGRRWQQRLKAGWSKLALGCQLDRDPQALLLNAGFKFKELEISIAGKLPAFVGTHYVGAARVSDV